MSSGSAKFRFVVSSCASSEVTMISRKELESLGSGCGSVGRAVASDTRGPLFESSHRQKFIYILNICLLSTVYRRDKYKEKEAGFGPF